jgi:hypothetical protein
MTLKCLLLLVLCLASSAHARDTFVGQFTDGDALWVQPDGVGTQTAHEGHGCARDLPALLLRTR